MEANCQITKREIEDNLENEKECVGIAKTTYRNLMLDEQILKTKKRNLGHMLFLPQEVVKHEVWIGGLQRRHNYK